MDLGKRCAIVAVVLTSLIGAASWLNRGEDPLPPDAWGRELIQGSATHARSRLTPQSLDTLAYYIYGQLESKGVAMEWARRVVQEVTDLDSEGLDNELERFRSLCEAAREGRPLIHSRDAAASAALLLYADNLDLPDRIRWEHGPSAQDLQRRGVSTEVIDALVMEYTRLRPDVYVAVLLPRGVHQLQHIVSAINELGTLVYDKPVCLHTRGPLNYVRHAYDLLCAQPHKWVRDQDVAKVQAAKRFSTDKPMHLLVFQAADWRQVRPWKLQVRSLPGMGTRALHCTDTYQESTDLAQAYLNANTIDYINLAQEVHCPSLEEGVLALKASVHQEGGELDSYCLDGDAVLAAYGLVTELDDLTVYSVKKTPETELEQNIADLIYDPRRHFSYRGVKCVRLKELNLHQPDRSSAAIVSSDIIHP